jgi:hypothetical protein
MMVVVRGEPDGHAWQAPTLTDDTRGERSARDLFSLATGDHAIGLWVFQNGQWSGPSFTDALGVQQVMRSAPRGVWHVAAAEEIMTHASLLLAFVRVS